MAELKNKITPEQVDKYPRFEDNILHQAVAKEDPNFIIQLLENGADINKKDKNGLTPLLVACKWNYLKSIKILLEHGANVNLMNVNRETPLFYACVKNHPDVVKILMDYGADYTISNPSGFTPLTYSCITVNVDCVRKLLESGVNPDLPDINGRMPLLIATKSKQVKAHLIVQLLLKYGANLYIQDDRGKGLIEIALEKQSSIIALIIHQEYEKRIELFNKSKAFLLLSHLEDENSLLYKYYLSRDIFLIIIKIADDDLHLL